MGHPLIIEHFRHFEIAKKRNKGKKTGKTEQSQIAKYPKFIQYTLVCRGCTLVSGFFFFENQVFIGIQGM